MPRILVIDDEAAVRKVIVRMLTSAGHEVSAAPDGAAGLRLWHEAGADLVLTDLHMPEMNGVEVIRALRAAAPTLPVIAMSGTGASREEDLFQAVQQLGSVGILGKPFSWDELVGIIAAALRRLS
jgi:CheY-like chemotaxis protein